MGRISARQIEGLAEIETQSKEVEKELDRLKSEIADFLLLSNVKSEAVSVYDMSYEEYLELPGNVRL